MQDDFHLCVVVCHVLLQNFTLPFLNVQFEDPTTGTKEREEVSLGRLRPVLEDDSASVPLQERQCGECTPPFTLVSKWPDDPLCDSACS